MRIAEAAHRAGTSPRMLRYYEAEGLLAPERTGNGYRDYDADDVSVAQRIVALSRAGLTLSAITTVLPCTDAGGTPLACPGVAAELRRQLDACRQQIAALTANANAVERYLAALNDSDRPHTVAS